MEKEIGKVTHFYDKISVAVVKMTKGALKKGDNIKIKGGDREVDLTVDSMQFQHKEVDEAKKGKEVGLKVSDKVREGYTVYLVK